MGDELVVWRSSGESMREIEDRPYDGAVSLATAGERVYQHL